MMIIALLLIATSAPTQANKGPTFSCFPSQSKIEALICKDPALSLLDLELAMTYRKARLNTDSLGVYNLASDRRAWRQRREKCANSEEPGACIKTAYLRRIAELSAKFGLIQPVDRAEYSCRNSQTGKIVIARFATDPKTLLAEYSGERMLMFAQTANVRRYDGKDGRGIVFENDQDIIFDNKAEKKMCKKL